MIRMITPDHEIRCPGTLWRLANNPRGTIATQDTHQVTPQLYCRLELAVGIIEENNIFDAKDLACGPLLILASSYHLTLRVYPDIGGFVGTTPGAISTNHVVHIPALACPQGDGAATAEFGIIWMGDNHQRDFILLLFAHRFSFLFYYIMTLLTP